MLVMWRLSVFFFIVLQWYRGYRWVFSFSFRSRWVLSLFLLVKNFWQLGYWRFGFGKCRCRCFIKWVRFLKQRLYFGYMCVLKRDLVFEFICFMKENVEGQELDFLIVYQIMIENRSYSLFRYKYYVVFFVMKIKYKSFK